MTREINENVDALMDGEFMLNEFVDRFGPRLAHLNGVLQILAQLSSTPNPASSSYCDQRCRSIATTLTGSRCSSIWFKSRPRDGLRLHGALEAAAETTRSRRQAAAVDAWLCLHGTGSNFYCGFDAGRA